MTKEELQQKLRQKIQEKRAIRNRDMTAIKQLVSECEGGNNSIGKQILETLEGFPKIKTREGKIKYLLDILQGVGMSERPEFMEQLLQLFQSKGQNVAV